MCVWGGGAGGGVTNKFPQWRVVFFMNRVMPDSRRSPDLSKEKTFFLKMMDSCFLISV